MISIGARAGALVAILTITAIPALAGERVGMITGIRGEVSLLSRGESEKARLMGLLRDGDRISVSAGSEATLVLFAEGQRMRLPSLSSVQVGAASLAVVSGPDPEDLPPLLGETLTVLRDQVLEEEPSRGAGVVFRGSGRETSELELLSPVSTRIADLHPLFRWKAGAGIERYRLTVSSLEGEELWEHLTQDTEVRYAPEAAQLEPGGFYFWDVRAFSDESIPAVAGADFTLLDESELEALVRSRAQLREMAALTDEDPTPRIALAALYRDLELFGDADEILRELGEQYPDEVLVKEALRSLYRQWGRELDTDSEKESEEG